MNADMLRITDPIISDESISEYEHLEYNPIAGTNLNDVGILRLLSNYKIFLPIRAKASFL